MIFKKRYHNVIKEQHLEFWHSDVSEPLFQAQHGVWEGNKSSGFYAEAAINNQSKETSKSWKIQNGNILLLKKRGGQG